MTYIDPPVEWEVSDYGDVDEQIKDDKIMRDMPRKVHEAHVRQMQWLAQHVHQPERGVDNGHEFVRCKKCGVDCDK